MYEFSDSAVDTIPVDVDEFVEFQPFEIEEFEVLDGYDEEWTDFEMLRGAVSENLAELSDEELSDYLWEQGFDAEELEGFMQVLGDIGKAIGKALPSIGTGAATGASVGSVVPGIGTGIGAAVGGVLGGLGSVLGQLAKPRPARPSRPSAPAGARTPTTVRPGVTRTPTPSATSPGTPAASSQSLLRLLTNPQVIRAITALALGPTGRESISVAGRDVPTVAFAELVAELAQESMHTGVLAPERYLAGEDGEALIDVASPAERAGGLIGLLALEALGAEVPFGEALGSLEDLDDSFDGEAEYSDQALDPGAIVYSEEVAYPDEAIYADDHEGVWGEAEPEAAPAIIAVAGVLISGANLGLGVFDRLERHFLSGAFEVTSHAASYIHNPSPRGLTIRTATYTFPVHAHHPRYGIGTQTFWFRLTLEYDGFNIRRVAIAEDRGRSSTLVSSDFKITFAPAAYSAPNEPVAAIAYSISGNWDPIGVGEESIDSTSRIIIDAQGKMSLRVSSPRRWVRHGRIKVTGGGRVPKPTVGRHRTSVTFDRPGKTRLTESAIRSLHSFYNGLPTAVKGEIRAGRIPIRVTGRASTTATVQRNQDIARQRAAAVAAVFVDLAGTSTRIVTAAHGELGARTPDNQEDPAERRADVLIEYDLFR